jgi:hypothetical protein
LPGERARKGRRSAYGLPQVPGPQVGHAPEAASAGALPPPQQPRRPRSPDRFRAHIDAMIDEDPAIGITAIWQRLADDHGVTVAYNALRADVGL